MITGSIGMLPSASLGAPGAPGPVRARPRLGARHRRDRGSANPLAMFLSAALMLRHGLGWHEEAAAVESAVDRALEHGLRTADLGGDATTDAGHRAPSSTISEGGSTWSQATSSG